MDKPGMERLSIKLLVFLAHSGACSRRSALTVIQGGRVTVNGTVVREPSTIINPGRDRIFLNGSVVKPMQYTYLLLNKPKGYVTTMADAHAEKTVLDLLPKHLRHLRPAGRLDKDTEGLLFLTNDGDIIYKLTHPKFNITKIYRVIIKGKLQTSEKQRLERGLFLDGKITAPARISHIRIQRDTTEFYMAIHEGRKRQIRCMLSQVGYNVRSLMRVQHGPLTLCDMPIGSWRLLHASEVAALRKEL